MSTRTLAVERALTALRTDPAGTLADRADGITRTLAYIDDDVDVIRRRTWGALAALAGPVLTHHHADLWIDGTWMRERITTAPITFYWAVDDTGTAIGDTLGDVVWRGGTAYRVDVGVEVTGWYGAAGPGARWTLTITRCPS